MSTSKVVAALFESASAAEAAVQDLEKSGVDGDRISTIGAEKGDGEIAKLRVGLDAGLGAALGGIGVPPSGLADALRLRGIPPGEASVYERSVDEGHVFVSVLAEDEAAAHRVQDVVERHNPMAFDRRIEDCSMTGAGQLMGGSEGAVETNAVRNTTSGLTGSSLSGGGNFADSFNIAHDPTTVTNAETVDEVGGIAGQRRTRVY